MLAFAASADGLRRKVAWKSGLEVDFVIRYKGECVLLEVKAKDGNTKSTRTILNHPEKYHVYHAIKLGNYNVGGKEGMMTMLFPKQTQRMAAFLPAFSSVMIALIVGIIVSANAPKLLTGSLLIVLVVMLHNICGLSLGYLVGRMLRLPHHKCSAISIEVGMQNSGLASSLATVHFAMYPMATVPGAIFSVWQMLFPIVLRTLSSMRLEIPREGRLVGKIESMSDLFQAHRCCAKCKF